MMCILSHLLKLQGSLTGAIEGLSTYLMSSDHVKFLRCDQALFQPVIESRLVSIPRSVVSNYVVAECDRVVKIM